MTRIRPAQRLLVSYRPKLFNVNGDQANIEIMAKELSWAAVHHRVIGLEEVASTDFIAADFVVFGSTSLAAREAFDQQLQSLIPTLRQRYETMRPTLYLGTSFEYFAEPIFGIRANQRDRVSDYYSGSYEGHPLVGYQNTEFDLPALVVESRQIGSLLSGPLLAKNRWLLNQILDWWGVVPQTPADVKAWL